MWKQLKYTGHYSFVFVGLAYRKCLRNNRWGSVSILNCRTVEILRIESSAKELRDIVQRRYNKTSDMTQTFSTGILLETIKQLESVTLASQPILPMDLSSIAKILNTIIL